MHAMDQSHSFAETKAVFSAMEAALRRNRNINLHKLPAECVLKAFETHCLPDVRRFFFFLIFLCLSTCAESRWEHFTDLAGATPLVSCSIIIDKCCEVQQQMYSN
jgi:hypothetical protein